MRREERHGIIRLIWWELLVSNKDTGWIKESVHLSGRAAIEAAQSDDLWKHWDYVAISMIEEISRPGKCKLTKVKKAKDTIYTGNRPASLEGSDHT